MTIKLYHKDATSCSVDGVVYEQEQDGSFLVSDHHAEHLTPHGFSTAQPEIEASADAPAKRGRRTKAEV